MAATALAAETMVDLFNLFDSYEARVPSESLVFNMRQDVKLAQITKVKIDKKINAWTNDYNKALVKAQTSSDTPHPFNPANDPICKRQVFLSSWFARHVVKINEKIVEKLPQIYGHFPLDDMSVNSIQVRNKTPSPYEARLFLVAAAERPQTITTLEENLKYANDAKGRLDKTILKRYEKLQKKKLSQRQRIAWNNVPRLEGNLVEIDESQRTYVKWFVMQIAKIEQMIASL